MDNQLLFALIGVGILVYAKKQRVTENRLHRYERNAEYRAREGFGGAKRRPVHLADHGRRMAPTDFNKDRSDLTWGYRHNYF